MSDDTWLCAVLMAASADSTSFGGSIPVISEASSTMPYRADDDLHSWSMCSLRSRRFLRRSLIETPYAAAASEGDSSLTEAVAATGGDSKLAIRSRNTDTK